MYAWLKSIILPLLRVEDGEPHPPAGNTASDVLRIERAAPGYLRLQLVGWGLYAVMWALAIIGACTALLLTDVRLVLLVIPLILVAVAKAATLYVTTRLDYEMRWYVITDRSLMIREGIWNTQEITLTFANAQNVRVSQGPLERLFGFSAVEIETAGGGAGETGGAAHRAVLRGLQHPHEVRDLILAGVRRVGTAGLGDPDDPSPLLHGASAVPSLPADGSRRAVRAPGTVLREAWDEAKALRVALERRRSLEVE